MSMDDAAWSAAALMTHPEAVREVHEDYVRAGRHHYQHLRNSQARAGDDRNGRAVPRVERPHRYTRERGARGGGAAGPIFVAGSISTFTTRYNYSYEPRAEKAWANYREQAQVLDGSGVDVIAQEMMRDLEQTTYAVGEAVNMGLPVWVGFSCKITGEGTVILWDGENTLAEALERLPPLGASLVSIMHTLTEDTPPALREVTERWSGPVGAYPHSGELIFPTGSS